MLDRWMHTQTAVHSSFSRAAPILAAQAPAILRRAFELNADEPSDDGAFTLRDILVWEAHTEQVELRVCAGSALRSNRRVCIPFRWDPQSTRDAHSSLDGELELTDDEADGAWLALNAVYRIPPASRRSTAIMCATQGLGREVIRAIAAALDAGIPPAESPSANLRVRDLMTAEPVVTRTEQSLLSATLLLLHHRIAGAPVIDEHGRLVGVLSETDMLAREASPGIDGGRAASEEEERRRQARTVGEACSRPAVQVHPDSSVREAARLLLDRDVGRLVVVDDDRVIGVLARHDVLRALIRTAEQLQHLVERAIRQLHEPGIRVAIDPGSRVRLTGTSSDAAAAAAAVDLAAAIDGVSGVDNELTWHGAQVGV